MVYLAISVTHFKTYFNFNETDRREAIFDIRFADRYADTGQKSNAVHDVVASRLVHVPSKN